MNLIIFYSAAVLAIATTVMVVLSRSPIYAVLYLIMSLFGVSLVFYTLGAPFIAVLEIIVYAGAIMVLFLFVVMMLNLGHGRVEEDLQRPSYKQMILPAAFAVVLLMELCLCVIHGSLARGQVFTISPGEIGLALYRQHYLGVELASVILLIGVMGGMHLGRAAADTDEKGGGADGPR